ncbi:MAG: hypothetical protein JNL01_09560 [Bdellovibrionales bacterium]|nr:hypothetical protein [Bdellovibrionales bacterium]
MKKVQILGLGLFTLISVNSYAREGRENFSEFRNRKPISAETIQSANVETNDQQNLVSEKASDKQAPCEMPCC